MLNSELLNENFIVWELKNKIRNTQYVVELSFSYNKFNVNIKNYKI